MLRTLPHDSQLMRLGRERDVSAPARRHVYRLYSIATWLASLNRATLMSVESDPNQSNRQIEMWVK